MIAIIDFGGGNLQSVKNALDRLGVESVITCDKEIIAKADKVIFPGQGHFGSCVAKLKEKGLFAFIRDIARTKPFLGICVGMQLLFEGSDEAPGTPGLAVLKGQVKRFRPGKKTPHMGWNQAIGKVSAPFYYFAHSFYCVPENQKMISATTVYDEEFAAIIQDENLWAVQFHPEKSGQAGREFLECFVRGKPC